MKVFSESHKVQKMELSIIKVGGGIIEQAELLSELLDNFCAIPGSKILIHGGGRCATKLATRLGLKSKMTDGKRITDESMLDIVTMVYGGLINKRIVAQLAARKECALGLTGADMNSILSEKRPVRDIDYGWVGDIKQINTQIIQTLISQGITPVIAPLTHDAEGHLLNTNADAIADAMASALAPFYNVTLTFAFEKTGVLLDADDDDSLIPQLDASRYMELKAKGCFSDGMLPKLENAFLAIKNGVKRVNITCALDLEAQNGTSIQA